MTVSRVVTILISMAALAITATGCASTGLGESAGSVANQEPAEVAGDDVGEQSTESTSSSTTSRHRTTEPSAQSPDPEAEFTTAEQARLAMALTNDFPGPADTSARIEDILLQALDGEIAAEDFFFRAWQTTPPEYATGNTYLMCEVAALGERCAATSADYQGWVERCDANKGQVVEVLVEQENWIGGSLCLFLLSEEMREAAERATRIELDRRGLAERSQATADMLTAEIMKRFASSSLTDNDLRAAAEPHMGAVGDWGWTKLACIYDDYVPPVAEFANDAVTLVDSREELGKTTSSSIGVAAAIVDHAVEVLVCEMHN